MRIGCSISLVLFTSLLLVGDAFAQTAQPKSPSKITLFVPAYFYPAGEGLKDWERLISAAEQVPITAIVNPASGPGERADPNYVKIVTRLRRAGATAIGYVSTQYAKRPIQEAKGDVDRWRRMYPMIGGIFFDEQASDAAQASYYRELFMHARGKIKRAFVASNPGVPCDAAYFESSPPDAICVFEHHKGFESFSPPAEWGERLRRRCAALPYEASDAEQMRERLRRAAHLRLGHFYATDDNGANPWDRLPVYWEEEVAAVRKANLGLRR